MLDSWMMLDVVFQRGQWFLNKMSHGFINGLDTAESHRNLAVWSAESADSRWQTITPTPSMHSDTADGGRWLQMPWGWTWRIMSIAALLLTHMGNHDDMLLMLINHEQQKTWSTTVLWKSCSEKDSTVIDVCKLPRVMASPLFNLVSRTIWNTGGTCPVLAMCICWIYSAKRPLVPSVHLFHILDPWKQDNIDNITDFKTIWNTHTHNITKQRNSLVPFAVINSSHTQLLLLATGNPPRKAVRGNCDCQDGVVETHQGWDAKICKDPKLESTSHPWIL